MAEQHPVQALRVALETSRLDLIERLAKSSSPVAESNLQLLATIQTALSAVREEVQAHGLDGEARTRWNRQRPNWFAERLAGSLSPQSLANADHLCGVPFVAGRCRHAASVQLRRRFPSG
jgi:hypothetical protein